MFTSKLKLKSLAAFLALAAVTLIGPASKLAAQSSFEPINLATVKIVGGAEPVRNFVPTASLDLFEVKRGGMTIRTSGTAGWPAVAIEDGGEPVQSGTLWVCTRPQGAWVCAGTERLRPNQLNGTKPEAEGPGELETLIGGGWLYDSGRWKEMAGFNPPMNTPIGVFIASGSTRSDDQYTVHERTKVQIRTWPTGELLWTEGDAAPVPLPPVVTPPVVVPPTQDLSEVFRRLDALDARLSVLAAGVPPDMKPAVELLQNDVADTVRRLNDVEAKKIPVGCDVKATLFGFKVSVGCTLY